MFQSFLTSQNAMDEVWDLAFSFRNQVSDVEQAFSMCAWQSWDAVCGMENQVSVTSTI